MHLALHELVHEVGGELSLGMMPPVAGEDQPIGRIVTEIERVTAGDVYWAWHDGERAAHAIEEAFARGAVGVIAHRSVEPWAGCWAVRIDDPQRALWQLAASARYRFAGDVILLFGGDSDAKAALIEAGLKRRLTAAVCYDGNSCAGGPCDTSPSSMPASARLPLEIINWDPVADYAVVALDGVSEEQIEHVLSLVQPVGAVVASLDYTADNDTDRSVGDAYVAARRALEYLPDHGWAVVDGDDERLVRLTQNSGVRYTSVGRSADCTLMATHVVSQGGRLSFAAQGRLYHVPVFGRHYLTPALAAVATAQYLQVAAADVQSGLADFASPPGHWNVSHVAGVTLIRDRRYGNHAASRAAIEVLRDIEEPGRRIVLVDAGNQASVSGGDWDAAAYAERLVELGGVDLLIVCGERAADARQAAHRAGMPSDRVLVCETAADMAIHVRRGAETGDVVLLKGVTASVERTIAAALRNARLLQAA